jgi:tellurite resistance protein TehA-like permease
VLHQVCSSTGFLALIVFCFVLGRRYRASGQPTAAAASIAAGALFALSVVTAGAVPHGSLTLFIGVSIALLWLAFTATWLIRGAPERQGRPGSE